MAITGKDMDDAMAMVRQQQSGILGAPKIPNVTWDDVGGLAHAKKEILDTIQVSGCVRRPAALSGGRRRAGMRR